MLISFSIKSYKTLSNRSRRAYLRTCSSSHSHWYLRHLASGLTHWGQVTHICVCKLTIIGSDNGLSPGRRQAIIWINTGILLIGPFGTNLTKILILVYTFSFKKMQSKCRQQNGGHFGSDLMYLRCVNACVADTSKTTKHLLSRIKPYLLEFGHLDNKQTSAFQNTPCFQMGLVAWWRLPALLPQHPIM